MGYNTYFQLKTDDPDEDHKEGISRFIGYNPFEDSCKWYDYESEMSEYSKLHPTTRFSLQGDGEDSGDLWQYHFKDGKSHGGNAKMEFPAYDESLLT